GPLCARFSFAGTRPGERGGGEGTGDAAADGRGDTRAGHAFQCRARTELLQRRARGAIAWRTRTAYRSFDRQPRSVCRHARSGARNESAHGAGQHHAAAELNMIVGNGVEWVEITRVQAALARHGVRVAGRLPSDREWL